MSDYGISSRSYLKRAKYLLSKSGNENLIYAMLELRCAIEARLQEILEPHDHISKNSKNEYRIPNLSKTIMNKLCDVDTGTKVIVTLGNEKITLCYIPVSSALRAFAQKAGNYLHAAQKPFKKEDWKKLKSDIEDAIERLEENLSGNLLGPLLLKKGGIVSMKVELIKDNRASAILAKAIKKSSEVIISVDYFKI